MISLEKHGSLTNDPPAALQETFVKTNTALMVTPMNYMTSGCTCVAVYLKGRTLYVANSGDSRAVMAVDDGNTTCMSKLFMHNTSYLIILQMFVLFWTVVTHVHVHFYLHIIFFLFKKSYFRI